MKRFKSTVPMYLLLTGTIGLAVVLLLSAVLMYRQFSQMQAVYLRDHAARIAARLETLTPDQLAQVGVESLSPEEPALLELEIYRAPTANPALEGLWSGRELFRTERVTVEGQRVFRAYIPFHAQSRLHVVRVDLAYTATDFLLVHARQNLLIASISGLVLLTLAIWGMWATRRHMRLEHLAHLGTMSAVLAHEIRNPLGTIKGFVQLAGEKADAGTAALLAPVIQEIGRLEKLVSDLLLYAKPCEPVMRLTEWSEIAAEIEANAREAIGDRPIRFRWENGSWRFNTDPDLLKEALINLARNSIEAGASEIVLRGSRAGIVLEDNGPGIADDVKSKLFQPFVTTKASGTGLGLSIAHKLVESLGGELAIGSVEPHGTRAEVTLSRGTNSDYRR